MNETAKLNVGDSISVGNASWTFGGEVANTFGEHVRRSVPMYEEGHTVVCKLSDFFVKPHSVCYELGCSVGELTLKLARHNQEKNATFIGIDTEYAMVQKAKENTRDLRNVKIEVSDCVLYEFEKTDLVVAYYCVQFIPPAVRQQLINKIYNALNWGGALIMFEKVRGPDARFQDILSTLYVDYKLEQNYSPEEIIAKTRSLKGVLEPFSTQGNIDLLKRAGFVDVMTVMKYLCFEGFLAIK